MGPAAGRFLLVPDVARLTGMAERTVRWRAARGLIPGAALYGSHWRFRPEAIARWLREVERAGAAR